MRASTPLRAGGERAPGHICGKTRVKKAPQTQAVRHGPGGRASGSGIQPSKSAGRSAAHKNKEEPPPITGRRCLRLAAADGEGKNRSPRRAGRNRVGH